MAMEACQRRCAADPGGGSESASTFQQVPPHPCFERRCVDANPAKPVEDFRVRHPKREACAGRLTIDRVQHGALGDLGLKLLPQQLEQIRRRIGYETGDLSKLVDVRRGHRPRRAERVTERISGQPVIVCEHLCSLQKTRPRHGHDQQGQAFAARRATALDREWGSPKSVRFVSGALSSIHGLIAPRLRARRSRRSRS